MTRSLITLQRSIAEAGRIRIGQQVPTKTGGRRPEKLDTFRLTSSDRRRIEQAAEAYGGKVEEWKAPAGAQWQVITERSDLDVIVPPSDLSFSQSYELWSAGGCQRRCDGVTESLSEGPCLCDPVERECDIHTRLSVLLRDLPGLGVWRLDTSGYYAATELAGAVEIIGIAAGTRLLPARLRLDQRSVKRQVDGKAQTFRFAVPVLDIEVTPELLLAGGQGQPLELAAAPRAMTPVPALETGEGRTIAQQSEPPGAAPRRRNAAAEIPSSGRRRAAATEIEQPGGSGPAEEEPEAGNAGGAEPSAVVQRDDRDGGSSDEAAPAGDGSPAGARSRSCTHPADKRRETDAGVVCMVEGCGVVLEAPKPETPTESSAPDAQDVAGTSSESAASSAKLEPGDEGYWMARLHAVAGERDIDHDGLRAIAAAVKRIPADEVEAFSLSSLEERTAEGLDKLLRQFPESLDVDGATEWVAQVAERKGLTSWEAIDPIAAAALPAGPDAATSADWIAFGLRLHAGDYDPPAETEKPKARSRAASREETTSG